MPEACWGLSIADMHRRDQYVRASIEYSCTQPFEFVAHFPHILCWGGSWLGGWGGSWRLDTGVGMGSYVESVARRLGFKEPSLTPEQMALSSCRYASNAGAASGVAFGCLLGMFPLLFYSNHGHSYTYVCI